MRLGDFIRETLTEIAFGIHEAKVDVKDLVAIVPGTIDTEKKDEATYIEFDIAVTVREATESSERDGASKANIEVLGIGFGRESNKGKETKSGGGSETVSRIAFKVPVYLTAHFRTNSHFDSEVEFIRALSERRKAKRS